MTIIRHTMVLITIAAIWTAAAPASAQTTCDDRAKLVNQLLENYAEFPVSMGLASDGTVIEVFTSARGTWTLLVTHPNGQSCLVATGESWESRLLPVSGWAV